MRFLFIGAGAIGSYVGGSLSLAGHQVSVIETPELAPVLEREGLGVKRGQTWSFASGVRVFPSAADALAAGPYQVAVCAVKSFDTESVARGLLDTGEEVPTVLSLQNGVDNEPTLASVLGPKKVMSGTVATAVSKAGPGRVIEEKHRGIGIGLGHPLSKLTAAAFDEAKLSAKLFKSPPSMKWSKLLTNLTGNATSAILDLRVDQLFADNRLYEVEVEVLRECLAVIKALGHRVVDLPGTPVRALALATRIPRPVAQPLLTKFLGSGRGDKMPSFHIDLYSGRGRSEVRWLNGAVVSHGAEVGVPTPVNEVLTETLEALTAEPDRIEEFRGQPQALLDLLK